MPESRRSQNLPAPHWLAVRHVITVRAKRGGGHVTWSGWGHVGAGFEVANVPPWSPRGTYGPWVNQIQFFILVTTAICNFFQL